KDYSDLMKAVDVALETFSFIDEDRLGVTGGSYGGFITNWIVGHTNRFKVAVTQRSISHLMSFRREDGLGCQFKEWQIQAGMDDTEKLWDTSPLTIDDIVETSI